MLGLGWFTEAFSGGNVRGNGFTWTAPFDAVMKGVANSVSLLV